MKQTGHRWVQMVRRYIRDGSLFRENSAGKLGLQATVLCCPENLSERRLRKPFKMDDSAWSEVASRNYLIVRRKPRSPHPVTKRDNGCPLHDSSTEAEI